MEYAEQNVVASWDPETESFMSCVEGVNQDGAFPERLAKKMYREMASALQYS